MTTKRGKPSIGDVVVRVGVGEKTGDSSWKVTSIDIT